MVPLPSSDAAERPVATRVPGPFDDFLDLMDALPVGGDRPLRVVVDTPERRFEAFFLGERVVGLYDASLAWRPQDTLVPEAPNQPWASLAAGPLYHLWREVATEQEALKARYRQQALGAAALLNRALLFNGANVTCHYEVAEEPLVERMERWDYLGETVEAFTAQVQEYLRREARLAEELHVDTAPWATLRLHHEGGEAPEVKDPCRGLVLAVATAGGSLQDMADSLTAFTTVECLEALQALMGEGLVTLTGATQPSEPSQVGAWATNAFDLAAHEQEEAVWHEGDGAVEAEAEDDSFVGTPFLHASIDADVKEVIARHVASPESKMHIFEYLLKNAGLVADVKAIEGELRPIAKRYREDLQALEDLRLEASLHDEEDELAPSGASVASERAFAEKRSSVDEAFNSLLRLERRRYEANEERRGMLEELLAVVPHHPEDEVSVRVQELLEAKLGGIDEVENLAYTPPARVAEGEPSSSAVRFSKLKDASAPAAEEGGLHG